MGFFLLFVAYYNLSNKLPTGMQLVETNEQGMDARPREFHRNSNITTEKLALLFYYDNLKKRLENGNIAIELRANIATQYLNDVSERSSIVPDISRGGLYKDWDDV